MKKKARKHFNKQLKKLPTLILIFSILGILFYFLKKNELIGKGNSVVQKVKIEYLRCPNKIILGTKNRNRKGVIKFSYQNKNYNLKIRKSVCNKLILGDSLQLLYNQEKDKFYGITE